MVCLTALESSGASNLPRVECCGNNTRGWSKGLALPLHGCIVVQSFVIQGIHVNAIAAQNGQDPRILGKRGMFWECSGNYLHRF